MLARIPAVACAVVLATTACSKTSPETATHTEPAPAPAMKPHTPDAVSTTRSWIRVAQPALRPEAVGLWRVPLAERRREAPGIVSSPGTVRFLYDGQTVTLFLLTEKEWMWRSDDDHYRLETEWRDDVLHYRPPFGRMTPLARFAADHFETTDPTPWRYEAVASRDACDADDLPLLADRPIHDYSIKPMDRRSP